jgi:hypothetical protein
VSDQLVSELLPNFEHETIKSTARRLTMAPIPDEMNFMEVIMMKMMVKHREGEGHQSTPHLHEEDPRIGTVELMNLALACARGNLHLNDPRENEFAGMGRDKAGPSGIRSSPSGERKRTSRWVWLRKGLSYEQGLGFVASTKEVR